MPADSTAARVLKILIPTVLVLVLWARYHGPTRSLIADFVSPALETRDHGDWRVEHSSQFSQSKVELIKQIDQLQIRLKNQELEQRDRKLLEEENEHLRRQLGLAARARYQLKAASILVSDPATGGRTYVIDRGELQGIQVGQAVLRGGNLDGRVVEVSRHTSRIMKVTDPNCKVSVRLADSRHHGVLIGKGENTWAAMPSCEVLYLPRDLDYEADMVVETSDLGIEVPPGIPVGILAPDPDGQVTTIVDGLYKKARLVPYVASDPQSYTFVLVVVATLPPDTRAALSTLLETNH